MGLFKSKEVEATLNKLGKKIKGELKNELEMQGHVASGRLRDSIDYKITGEDELTFTALPRWRQVNDKQPAGRFVARTKLVYWLRQKGVVLPNGAKSKMVFNIQKIIFEEGTPTKGAKIFSKTGKRTGFM